MKLDVKFYESNHSFAPQFGETQVISGVGGDVSETSVRRIIESYLDENSYINQDSLDSVISDVLMSAKESGEFDGVDGVGVYEVAVNAEGHLIITLTSGGSIDVGRVVGKDGYTPVKGKDYFDGAPGEPGYTPIKGTDYLTADDKAELVAAVIENFVDVSKEGM